MHTPTLVPLAVLSLFGLVAVPAQDRTGPALGIWQGTPRTMFFELHLAVRVESGEGGAYRATVDLLDERLGGFPVEDFSYIDDAVKFSVPELGARFAGTLIREGPRRMEGHWLQGMARIPAVFNAVSEVSWPPRPQDPSGSVAYRSLDVAFSHEPARGLDASFRPVATDSEDAVTLAGTVTLPNRDGPHPAAVLIAGSGYQSRNATNRGHDLFHVLADHLTRRGFAVLRYDKRGCGLSSGSLAGSTSADFAVDARAALRYLHSRDDVDAERLGLIGHSEGGMIAPMVAAGPDAGLARFVVSLAPPGVNGEDMIVHQVRRMTAVHGAPTADLDVIERFQERLFDILHTIDDADRRRAAIVSAARGAWGRLSPSTRHDLGDAEANLVEFGRRFDDPWMHYFTTLDPAAEFERVECPILVLCGGKDLHVDPEQSLPSIRAALAAGSNPDSTVSKLAGLNHLFQTCGTGSPSEYFDIEETFAPVALDAITNWLRARFAARPPR